MQMGIGFLMLVLWMFCYFSVVSANAERDALITFKSNLSDPNKVLTSWNDKEDNPCTWTWVTCNHDNKVTRIDLENKNLSGQLVAQLGSLSNLTYLKLYSNNISGEIPPELGNLTNLVSLELYQNNLSGPIPDELCNLSRLRILRLGNNVLSGRIPVSLTTINTLQVLDVANNSLSGPIPVNGSFSLFTPSSFQNNPYLWHPFIMPESAEADVKVEKSSVGYSGIAAIAASISAVTSFLFGLFVATALVLWRNRKDQDHFFDVSAEDDPEIQLGALYWYSPRALNRFSLTDLQVATDNFNPKNIVGRGGFGQVYKGCLTDGSLVAVKRLRDVHNIVEELQFQTEVEMMSLVIHPNLLRLQGFCMTPTEKLLVYPFMANGSLASCLQAVQGSKPILDWGKRKQIALGSAN